MGRPWPLKIIALGFYLDREARLDNEIEATENLFVDFYATCNDGSGSGGPLPTLDSVAEFEQLLGDHVCSLQRALDQDTRISSKREHSNVREVKRKEIGQSDRVY